MVSQDGINDLKSINSRKLKKFKNDGLFLQLIAILIFI